MEAIPAPSALPTVINWDLAASTAASLAAAGPDLSGKDIAAVVADLRSAADAAVAHVHNITGLAAARDLRDSQVLVVDRASWAKANTQSFSVMLGSTLERLAAKQAEAGRTGSLAVGGALTGAQLGGVLAFLSSKVLGQYDPFAALAEGSTGSPAGRLLLVAPNIITIERELNVEPADFRLWVCLHEQTHRVQFAAAPWLRHHMLNEIDKLGGTLLGNAENMGERISSALRSLGAKAPGSLTGGGPAGHGSGGVPSGGHGGGPSRGGILDLLQDPEEKAAISHLTAVMSLLEGHANVVMDAVDASIVPTVKTIRQRFNARGADRGTIEKFFRKLLGLDAKMRQYSDGSRFVRAVVAQCGMSGFNRVWEAEENLPTEQEIHDASLWIARMGL